MNLTRFRVMNFRSVEDSGWIVADDVTALIGVNESGKTNLLLPLWKLNPARDGEIQPTSDFPKTMFGEIRANPGDYRFIVADFETGEKAVEIAKAAGITAEEAGVVRVTRFFDAKHRIDFPQYKKEETIEKEVLLTKLNQCADQVDAGNALKSENELQRNMSNGLRDIASRFADEEKIGVRELEVIRQNVNELVPDEPAKTSVIVPLVRQLSDQLTAQIERIAAPAPGEDEKVPD